VRDVAVAGLRTFIHRMVMYPTIKAGGLLIVEQALRSVRRHDCSPTRNVPGSDGICGTSEPASNATDPPPGGTVPFVDVVAFRTGPRSVLRIYQSYRNSRYRRFVGDKSAELIKRPGMQVGALSFTNRYPVTDALEVFKGNAASGAFGFADELFTDAVVDVPRHAGLFPSPFLEQSSSGLGALGLKFGAQCQIAATYVTQCLTRVFGTVRVGGDINYPEVDPEPIVNFVQRLVRDFDHDREVEVAVSVNQVSGTTQGTTVPGLVAYPDVFASVYGQDRDDTFPGRENSLVVFDCTVASELGLDPLVPLVRSTRFGYSSHRHLGGKSEFVPNSVVGQVVYLKFIGGLMLESDLGNPISGSVTDAQSLQQRSPLPLRRCEFELFGQQHFANNCSAPYLPTAKAGGISGRSR
jgi:hypothetical protein